MNDVLFGYEARQRDLVRRNRELTQENHRLRGLLAPFRRWARARCDADTLASTAPVVANSPGCPSWAELRALLED
jgi:hypothetical protein